MIRGKGCPKSTGIRGSRNINKDVVIASMNDIISPIVYIFWKIMVSLISLKIFIELYVKLEDTQAQSSQQQQPIIESNEDPNAKIMNKLMEEKIKDIVEKK
ncbi:hypothetical protein CR513_41462, partial [Mucuna pruriens]